MHTGKMQQQLAAGVSNVTDARAVRGAMQANTVRLAAKKKEKKEKKKKKEKKRDI